MVLPKGPSYTACLRTRLPNTIPGIAFGKRVLKWAVYGPFGYTRTSQSVGHLCTMTDGAQDSQQLPGPSKEPKTMAQYPKIESIGSTV